MGPAALGNNHTQAAQVGTGPRCIWTEFLKDAVPGVLPLKI